MPFIIILTILFLCFPVLMIPINFLLMNVVQDKSRFYFLILFSMGVGMFGIHFIPDGPYDIVRYIYNLHTLKLINNPFDLFDVSKIKSYGYTIGLDTNVLFNIYSWIISKMNRTYLFSFISMTVIYFTYLVPVVSLMRNKINLGIKLLSTFLICISLPLVVAISAVRWPIAAGLFVLVQYIYFTKYNNMRMIWILLVPALFHSSLIILVLPTLMVALLRLQTIKSILLLFIGIILAFPTVLGISSAIHVPFFETIVQKFNDYSNTSLNHGFWLDNGGAIVTAIGIILLIKIVLSNINIMEKNDRMYILSGISSLLIFMGMYLFDPPLTPRFNWIMPVIIITMIMFVFSKKYKMKNVILLLILLIFIIENNWHQFLQGFISQALRLQDSGVWTDSFLQSVFNFGE